LAALGRWQDHIDALERLADATDPSSAARVYAQAAEVYEHHLAYTDKAMAMWGAAAEADPEFGHAYAEQARLATEIGDHELSFTLWQSATGRLEGRALATALVNSAQAAQLAGAVLDVLATLKQAVDIDPRNPVARSAYEHALMESGDMDAIMQLLDRELETAEGEARADVYVRRAAIQFFHGHNESNALKSIEAAIEAGAARPAAALRADIHLVGGIWEAALTDYRTALGDDDILDPRGLAPRAMFPGEDPLRHSPATILLFRAGYASEASGRYNDAQDFYASASLEDDTFAPAAVGLARLAFRQGNHDGAALYISAYRAAGPGIPELDVEVADLASRLGLS
jgi:tetratricopeptide (TPR) repeat protein